MSEETPLEEESFPCMLCDEVFRTKAHLMQHMKSKTTDRQNRILAYLREKPGATVREVGEAVGLRSPASTWDALGRLEEKGLLKRLPCPTCGALAWLITKEEAS